MLSGKTVEDVCKEAEELDTLKYKLLVADHIIAHLTPIRQRISEFVSEPQYLMDVLQNGADKASKIAETTIQEVRQKLGLRFKERSVHKVKAAV